MNDHYVSYEQAVALKQLGFNWLVYTHYTQDDNNVRYSEDAINWNNSTALFSAPRIDQAQAWIRDKFCIHISVNPYSDCSHDADGRICDEWYFWSYELMTIPRGKFIDEAMGEYSSYYEALSAGITTVLTKITENTVLKILEEKK